MRRLAFFIVFALITPFLISDAIAAPVERVPITSFGAYSSDGKEIQEIVAGSQANLVSNATNTLDAKQSFVYGTWIAENNGTRTPIDWIETSLDAKSSSAFSIPWIPDAAGKYTIEASIWEDNETFTAFSAIWQVTLDVIAKDSGEKLVPEPEHEQDSPVYENCGSGATLQNGICVVDKMENSTEISADPSERWGVPALNYVKSPLKQFKTGIPVDEIQCNDSLVPVTKNNGSPACVTEPTKTKLIERGWMHAVPANLTLHDAQSWGYIKDVAILGNGYAGITMSYPTNEAYHELYPDNDNFIVGNCDVQDGSASLSVLYLNDIDSDANTITFTKEDKIFDGMSCDDAFWNEMTKNGYCGPTPHLMSQRETLVSSITGAQNMVDFVLHAPTYLPTGYDVQKIRAGDDRKHATLFISPFSVTNETDMCAFTWSDGGIYLSYASLPEGAPRFSNDPDRERITINGNRGYAEYREIGDRAGTPIPQGSEITWHMPEGNLVLNMYSSLSAEEMIKIAESIG